MFSQVFSNIAVKSFDRVLGGFVLSFAGGAAGLYSINSFLSNLHLRMSNVSHYTFSGRTSCIIKDYPEKLSDEEHSPMEKIATFAEGLELHIAHPADSDNAASEAPTDISTKRVGSVGTSLLFNIAKEAVDTAEGGPSCQPESLPRPTLQRTTSPTMLDLLCDVHLSPQSFI